MLLDLRTCAHLIRQPTHQSLAHNTIMFIGVFGSSDASLPTHYSLNHFSDGVTCIMFRFAHEVTCLTTMSLAFTAS